jgi:hypothetical protein
MTKILIKQEISMKSIIALVALAFATASFACNAHEAHAKKEEVNCVTKDKKGNCPPPPKGEKPTPKKVEKKEDKKVDDKKAEPAKK